MALEPRPGARRRATIDSTLAPVTVPSNRISAAVFTIPRLGSHPAERPATLCVTAGGLVNWGGTPLPAVPSPAPPTAGGHPLTGRIAVWYLPPAGSQRSYLSRIGAILDRASLFRPEPRRTVAVRADPVRGCCPGWRWPRCAAWRWRSPAAAGVRAGRRRGCLRSPR